MLTQSQTSTAPLDRELERRIRLFLASKHWHSLRRIEVQAVLGVVTLRGRVASFYEKLLATHCGRRVAGVVHLVDAVEVADVPMALAGRAKPIGGFATTSPRVANPAV